MSCVEFLSIAVYYSTAPSKARCEQYRLERSYFRPFSRQISMNILRTSSRPASSSWRKQKSSSHALIESRVSRKHGSTFDWKVATGFLPPSNVRVGCTTVFCVMNACSGCDFGSMGNYQYPLQKSIGAKTLLPARPITSESMWVEAKHMVLWLHSQVYGQS